MSGVASVAASTESPAAAPTPTTEATPSPTPESSKPLSEEEALRIAATRTRSTIKITGRVLDSSLVGIANATLVMISPTGMVLTATTDNDGRYSFTVATPSQKTYRVIPSKDGYSFTPVDKIFVGLFDDQRAIDFIATKQ